MTCHSSISHKPHLTDVNCIRQTLMTEVVCHMHACKLAIFQEETHMLIHDKDILGHKGQTKTKDTSFGIVDQGQGLMSLIC